MGLFDLFKTKKDKNKNTTANTFVCDICKRTLQVSCRHHVNVCASCATTVPAKAYTSFVEATAKKPNQTKKSKVFFEYGRCAMNLCHATFKLEKNNEQYCCKFSMSSTPTSGVAENIEIPQDLINNNEIKWDKLMIHMNDNLSFCGEIYAEYKPYVITEDGVYLPKGLTCVKCGKELMNSGKTVCPVIEGSDYYSRAHSINGQPYCNDCFNFEEIALVIPNSRIHICKRQYSHEGEFYYQTWETDWTPIAGKIPDELIVSNKIDSEELYIYIKSKYKYAALVCEQSAYIVDLANWSVMQK